MADQRALIMGATGLVGRLLTASLLDDERYGRVTVFGRRSTGLSHEKLEEHLVDFEDIEAWQHRLQGDVLFSTFGTTMKQAESRAAFTRIDFDYPLEVARQARANGVPRVVLLSSIGANERAHFVYLAVKGKLDTAVKGLGFEQVVILKPSALVGDRDQPRLGERASIGGLRVLTQYVPGLSKLRPIDAAVVAQAMNDLGVADLDTPIAVYESNEIVSFVEGLRAV